MSETKDIKTKSEVRYRDLVITDIQYHVTPARNPKQWYPKLVSVSKRNAADRIYTNYTQPFVNSDGRIGLELKFPVTKEVAAIYDEAARSGSGGFKILAPKTGIRVHPDKNALEKIRSLNRKGATRYISPLDLRAQLSTFDIKDGSIIMKVLFIDDSVKND